MDRGSFPPLVCPVHRCGLAEDEQGLRCPEGEFFPTVGGIHRFVDAASYADHFGAQWKRYRLVQLDSFTGLKITEERAHRNFGDELWNDLNDKQVLEVGCGAGRFTEVLLGRGAVVTSIDLSVAVEANQENFPQDERHRVVQADAVAAPILSQQFDVVFCLGVIQHTPSPDDTILALYDHVKPGGHLVFDHYTRRLSTYTKITEPVVRRILRRVSTETGIRWTERLVKFWLPVHRAARRFRPMQALLSRISPVRTYYHAYPELNEAQQREWAMLDTHDALTSWYRHTRTCGDVRSLLSSAGANEIECRRGGNGIEVHARRPSAAPA